MELLTEKQQINSDLPIQSPVQEPLNSTQNTPEANQLISTPNDKKFANRTFNLLTYLGFGWVANSSLSLWITYHLMPTEGAQRFIKTLENGFEKIIGGAVAVFGNGKTTSRNHLKYVGEKARSATEICCMMIAGSIILLPMKLMEDHKEAIVNKIDRWWNKDKYRNSENDECAIPQPVKDKQTWGKLLWARIVGMGMVLGIDQLIEASNNRRFDKGLQNIDSTEWKMGNAFYDKMPTRTRDGLINFFSSKKAGMESIQPRVRKRLLETINAPAGMTKVAEDLIHLHEKMDGVRYDSTLSTTMRKNSLDALAKEQEALLNTFKATPELREISKRAVMAEQTRLFSKEVSLTLVMAGLIYGLSKTGIVSSILSACGLKRADAKNEESFLLSDTSPASGISVRHQPVNGKCHPPDKPTPKPKEATIKQREKITPATTTGYMKKIASETEANTQPQLSL